MSNTSSSILFIEKLARGIHPFIEKNSADLCSKVIALLECKIVFGINLTKNYFEMVSLPKGIHTAFCQRNGPHLSD